MMDWTTAQSAEVATIAACGIAALSLVGLAIAACWNAQIRKADLRQREFETYHQLIHDLVVGKSGDSTPFVDCQVAAAYELRNYMKYRDVTCRILRGLDKTWRPPAHPAMERVLDEINLTLSVLEKV